MILVDDIVQQLDAEGFKVEAIFPGFVVGKRRKSPRFLTIQNGERSVTLHDTFKVLRLVKEGDVLTFEVIIDPIKGG